MVELQIILPVGQIPLHSTVSKVKGVNRYTLKDRLRAFSSDGSPRRDIIAEAGTVFLCNEGDGNAVSAGTLVVWHTDLETLYEHFHPMEDK
jgi:hypothetical protein